MKLQGYYQVHKTPKWALVNANRFLTKISRSRSKFCLRREC